MRSGFLLGSKGPSFQGRYSVSFLFGTLSLQRGWVIRWVVLHPIPSDTASPGVPGAGLKNCAVNFNPKTMGWPETNRRFFFPSIFVHAPEKETGITGGIEANMWCLLFWVVDDAPYVGRKNERKVWKLYLDLGYDPHPTAKWLQRSDDFKRIPFCRSQRRGKITTILLPQTFTANNVKILETAFLKNVQQKIRKASVKPMRVTTARPNPSPTWDVSTCLRQGSDACCWGPRESFGSRQSCTSYQPHDHIVRYEQIRPKCTNLRLNAKCWCTNIQT